MNYICSENHHYTYGTMSEITVDGGAQLWQLVSESGRGMTTGTASGPLHTSLAYDLGGHVTSRKVGLLVVEFSHQIFDAVNHFLVIHVCVCFYIGSISNRPQSYLILW